MRKEDFCLLLILLLVVVYFPVAALTPVTVGAMSTLMLGYLFRDSHR